MNKFEGFFYTFYISAYKYPTPSNLNYNYNFGVLALVCLPIQIITGILAVMFYTNHVTMAFESISRLMLDIVNGYILRYVHANVASFFFIAVFLHIARSFFYGSYKSPRTSLWYSGILILFLLIIIAFLGYTLPWGQMSFWGATVITNFVTVIPYVGYQILEYLWGSFSVSNPTLAKFFSLHFFLPFVLIFLIFYHLFRLHTTGSSNPLGIPYQTDKIFFSPYYTLKDLFTVFIFFFCLIFVVGEMPNFLGHSDNWIKANNLSTPAHIVPEWYFLFFYAILRAIPNKTLGVLFLLLSIFCLIIPAVIARLNEKKIPKIKKTLLIFGIAIALSYIGGHTYNSSSNIFLIYCLIVIYFSFYLVVTNKAIHHASYFKYLCGFISSVSFASVFVFYVAEATKQEEKKEK